jgi:hypothetical protein
VSSVHMMKRVQTTAFMQSVTWFAFLTAVVCGCHNQSESNEPAQTYTTERDAALISVARKAALAQGWTLEDCVYSVRREGSGWIVQVDRAPGFTGEGQPAVILCATFFIHIDAEKRPTRLLSHTEDISLVPPATESQNEQTSK